MRKGLSTVAAIAAGVPLLLSVGAAAHSTPATGSRSGFHCTASSQAPAAGGQRATGKLVPGRPVALELCRYGPAPSYVLEASRAVTRHKRVHRLVRGFRALPTPPAGPISCPNDDGSSIVTYAFYRHAATRIVHVGLSGCLIASRGDVVRWDAPSGGRFVRKLERLTR